MNAYQSKTDMLRGFGRAWPNGRARKEFIMRKINLRTKLSFWIFMIRYRLGFVHAAEIDNGTLDYYEYTDIGDDLY